MCVLVICMSSLEKCLLDCFLAIEFFTHTHTHTHTPVGESVCLPFKSSPQPFAFPGSKPHCLAKLHVLGFISLCRPQGLGCLLWGMDLSLLRDGLLPSQLWVASLGVGGLGKPTSLSLLSISMWPFDLLLGRSCSAGFQSPPQGTVPHRAVDSVCP